MCIRVRRRVHGEYFLFLQRFQIEFVLRLMSTTERLTTNKLGSDAQTLIGSSTTKLSPGLNRGKVTTYRSSKDADQVPQRIKTFELNITKEVAPLKVINEQKQRVLRKSVKQLGDHKDKGSHLTTNLSGSRSTGRISPPKVAKETGPDSVIESSLAINGMLSQRHGREDPSSQLTNCKSVESHRTPAGRGTIAMKNPSFFRMNLRRKEEAKALDKEGSMIEYYQLDKKLHLRQKQTQKRSLTHFSSL
eukprot:TRINITY_DN2137_c0_g1_i1.p1 TRINITY_DN2137_c0_g1~~TRINITY_DN2137_c0_g1_i1.p1  ORF type:complete len:247 (-),score=20.96 TRINITY_DN2137_c0_g1_i1:211-951(-)